MIFPVFPFDHNLMLNSIWVFGVLLTSSILSLITCSKRSKKKPEGDVSCTGSATTSCGTANTTEQNFTENRIRKVVVKKTAKPIPARKNTDYSTVFDIEKEMSLRHADMLVAELQNRQTNLSTLGSNEYEVLDCTAASRPVSNSEHKTVTKRIVPTQKTQSCMTKNPASQFTGVRTNQLQTAIPGTSPMQSSRPVTNSEHKTVTKRIDPTRKAQSCMTKNPASQFTGVRTNQLQTAIPGTSQMQSSRIDYGSLYIQDMNSDMSIKKPRSFYVK